MNLHGIVNLLLTGLVIGLLLAALVSAWQVKYWQQSFGSAFLRAARVTVPVSMVVLFIAVSYWIGENFT